MILKRIVKEPKLVVKYYIQFPEFIMCFLAFNKLNNNQKRQYTLKSNYRKVIIKLSIKLYDIY